MNHRFSGATSPETTVAVAPPRSQRRAEIAQPEPVPGRSPRPEAALSHPLTVSLKLASVPAWFADLATAYAAAKPAAMAVCQARAKDEKSPIATAIWRTFPLDMPATIKSALVLECQAEWRRYRRWLKSGAGVPSNFSRRVRFCVHQSAVSFATLATASPVLRLRVRKSDGLYADLPLSTDANGELYAHGRQALLTAMKICETEFVLREGEWYANVSIQAPVLAGGGPALGVVHVGLSSVTAAAVLPSLGFETRTWQMDSLKRIRERNRAFFRHVRRAPASFRRRFAGREGRMARQWEHAVSLRMADWLAQHGVGLLIIGEHTGIRKGHDNPLLARWNFAATTAKIVYKCRLRGIEAYPVHEGKLKTRCCWRCGEETDWERKEISCRCGNRCGAAWNAVRNLLMAAGVSGTIFRKPAAFLELPGVCDKSARRFEPMAFGVKDMRERLQHWRLRG